MVSAMTYDDLYAISEGTKQTIDNSNSDKEECGDGNNNVESNMKEAVRGMIFNPSAETYTNELLSSIDFGNSVYSTGTIGNHYMYESSYQSYLENKIENEKRLASMLRLELPVKESRLIAIQEAKLSDSLKAKWNKLIEFIKGIARKFLEAMSNILLSEKEYLEKYKEIILERKPKPELEYSYVGNYPVGIERIYKVYVPLFSGKLDGEAPYDGLDPKIEDGWEKRLLTTLLQRSGAGMNNFSYDENKNLAENCKNYFFGIAGENDTSRGKIADLNMQELYDFCYNFKKIEDVVKKDENNLATTTNNFTTAYETALKARGVDNNKAPEQPKNNNPESQNSTPASTVGSKPESGVERDQRTAENGADGTEESVIYNTKLGSLNESKKGTLEYKLHHDRPIYMNEEMNVTNSSTGSTGTKAGADAANASSYTNNDQKSNNKDAGTNAGANEVGDADELIANMNKMADRWRQVCSAIFTAKCTASQTIGKDYMEIIRAHVRSYGGKDIEKAENKRAAQKNNANYKKNTGNKQEAPQQGNEGENASGGEQAK